MIQDLIFPFFYLNNILQFKKEQCKLEKILTNSKYLVDMKSYDCLNLGIAYGYKWILIILNQKWDTCFISILGYP